MTPTALLRPGFYIGFFHSLVAFFTLIVHRLLKCGSFFHLPVTHGTPYWSRISLPLVMACFAILLEKIGVLFNLLLMKSVGKLNRTHLFLYIIDGERFRSHIFLRRKNHHADKCK